MNLFRKIAAVLVVAGLGALALPASAADKLFTVRTTVYTLSGTTVTPVGSTIPQNTTVIVLVDYFNRSPNTANSVVKAVDGFVPTDVYYAVVDKKTLNTTNANPVVNCSAPPASYFPSTLTGTQGLGTATGSPASYNFNGLTGVKPNGHFCLYLAVKTTSTTCTAQTWKFEANTGNSIGGGQPFVDYNIFVSLGVDQPYTFASTTDGCTGVLGCEATNNKAGNPALDPTQDIAYSGTPDWGLVRSKTNKNLVPCGTAVPFQFTFDPSFSGDDKKQTALFEIPDTLGEQVAVSYVMLWTPVPVDGDTAGDTAGWSTTPSDRLKMAWVKDAGGNYVYVHALRCVIDDLSIGYAALPLIPNTAYWQAIGATYPEYAPGAQAKMCVAQVGSTSVGRVDPNDNTSPILVQFWHKVLDYVDAAWAFE